jgi:holo-[acyl-carrier protein] synthase
MLLTGGAARRLERMAPAGYTPRVHVTLTDDFPMAHAVVIISGELADGNGNLA